MTAFFWLGLCHETSPKKSDRDYISLSSAHNVFHVYVPGNVLQRSSAPFPDSPLAWPKLESPACPSALWIMLIHLGQLPEMSGFCPMTANTSTMAPLIRSVFHSCREWTDSLAMACQVESSCHRPGPFSSDTISTTNQIYLLNLKLPSNLLLARMWITVNRSRESVAIKLISRIPTGFSLIERLLSSSEWIFPCRGLQLVSLILRKLESCLSLLLVLSSSQLTRLKTLQAEKYYTAFLSHFILVILHIYLPPSFPSNPVLEFLFGIPVLKGSHVQLAPKQVDVVLELPSHLLFMPTLVSLCPHLGLAA